MHRQPAVYGTPALQGMFLCGQPYTVQQKYAEARHTKQQNRKFASARIGYCERSQHYAEREPEQEVIRREDRQSAFLGEADGKPCELEHAHNSKKPCAQPLPARIAPKAIRENKQQAQGI
ncbi:hypothetical protein KC345_g11179 [Hortaea werneckii]|nr:hypothetical protein KC345_g11179 [Hortaea werneckii]